MFLQILLQVMTDEEIKKKASEAASNAFGNAMIRNILIIVGIGIVYAIIKGSSKKKDETPNQ